MNKVIKKCGTVCRKSLSLVIALAMMFSICAVSGASLNASAANASFENMEALFLDVSGFTSWNDASSTFKAYFFYSDNQNWNYENDSDADLYTSAKLAKATTLTKVDTNVYKVSVPGGEIGSVQFLRLSSDGTTKYNATPKMTAASRGTGNNCVKVSGWDASTWTTYSNTPTVKGGIYNATGDSSITNNSDLYRIKATFYDYYNDDEVANGWRNIKESSSRNDWEPYQTFNSYLANYARTDNTKYPLYFGNFYGKSDGYVGAGSSNLFNFSNWVNNSANLGGMHNSLTGLTANTLDSNGNLLYQGGSVSPLFDETWLTENGLGTVVKTSDFPMRKLTDTYDNTYYEFASNNAQDNIWFGNYENVQTQDLTLSYGSGTQYGVKDALSHYSSPVEADGYGFLPFDKYNQNSNHYGLDFGFGIRYDINFNVAENGLLKGNQIQKFYFNGDDDLWVFVDGVLVLDLGGDHKKADGYIDFNSLTTNVTTGSKSVTTETRNGSFPNLFGESGTEAFNNNDPTQTHTITMFYMERGMIESNLKFGFNFTPVSNQFITEKQIDTTNVNSGLADAVKEDGSFTFTHKTSETQTGTYTNSANVEYQENAVTNKTTTSDGKFGLQGGYSAYFTDKFNTGDYFKVTEDASTATLQYDTLKTTWTATDLVLQQKGQSKENYTIASGTGVDSSFKFNTLDTSSQFNQTKVKLLYTNVPKVGNLDVSKTALDTDGKTHLSDTDFAFTIYVDLGNGSGYQRYNLDYTLTDKSGAKTNKTAANGDFIMKGDNSVSFTNIPVGAKYKVVESTNADYTTVPANRTFEGTISENNADNAVTFVNTKINKSPATVIISASKKLDNEVPDVNDFEFSLSEINADGQTVKDIQTVNNNKGSVTFDPISYEYVEPSTTVAPTTAAPTTVQPTTVAPTTVAPTTTPVSTNTLYFVPSTNWKEASARFAVYVWNSSSDNAWFSLADADNDGVYSVDLGSKTYANAIFCRMNPAATDNSWSNKWNQTSDQTIPSGKNCFTVNSGEWDSAGGTWSTKTNTYSLSRTREAAEYSAVNLANNKASHIEMHYYKIVENVGSDTTYKYDSAEYYVAVSVDKNATPVSAVTKYYKSLADAVAGTNEVSNAQVVFNNYHNGTVEIAKKDSAGNPVISDVRFKLYKTDKDGGSLDKANLIDKNGNAVTDSSYAGELVDSNGIVTYNNLDLFVNQAEYGTEYQWYCFVESDTKDGMVIDSTKYYFMIPKTQALENQSSTDYDVQINNVKYDYVLKNGNKIYNEKYEIVNYAVTMPDASGNGINIFVVAGLGVVGTGVMLATAYVIYDKNQRRKRKQRCTVHLDKTV